MVQLLDLYVQVQCQAILHCNIKFVKKKIILATFAKNNKKNQILMHNMYMYLAREFFLFSLSKAVFTHWIPLIHTTGSSCVSELAHTGSDNELLPVWCHAII